MHIIALDIFFPPILQNCHILQKGLCGEGHVCQKAGFLSTTLSFPGFFLRY